jgi:hypothetical protein
MFVVNSGPADVPTPVWRFAVGSEEAQPAPRHAIKGELGGELLDRAWSRLLISHAPFLPVDDREYARVIDRYRDLEQILLGDPELQDYYAESFLTSGAREKWTGAGTAPEWKLHHVVTLQSQLMEDAFYAFRLDRYANAQDNRGWMNLFRRWGSSATFKARFEVMRETFSRDFVDFYDYYLRDLPPIDSKPVPHPWDPRSRRKDDRPKPETPEEDHEWADSFSKEMALGERFLPGVYLDSGIREATPEKLQTPHTTPGQHGAELDKPSAPTAPPPPAEGGSASGPGAVPNQ